MTPRRELAQHELEIISGPYAGIWRKYRILGDWREPDAFAPESDYECVNQTECDKEHRSCASCKRLTHDWRMCGWFYRGSPGVRCTRLCTVCMATMAGGKI